MKCFKMRFLFTFVALVATLVLFACNGNGKTGDKKNEKGQDNPENKVTPSDQVMLEFDAKKITVKDIGKSIVLGSGSEVKLGTQLEFSVVEGARDKNKIFDGFYINGDKKRVEEGEKYVVTAEHAEKINEKNVIKITFKEREKSKEKVKITFAGSITATTKKDNGSVTVMTGEKYEEGTVISFTATVIEGKILDSWFVNDTDKGCSNENRNIFVYTINLNDAKGENGNKEIEVKFKDKDVKKITIQYDEEKIEGIECKEGSDWKELKQNEEVKTGSKIIFKLKNDLKRKGKTADYYTINGKKNVAIVTNVLESTYEVNEKDAEAKGDKLVIRISAEVRDLIKAKLKFDAKDIKIVATSVGSNESIEKKDGDEVEEGSSLIMTLKDENKKIEQWLCNGTTLPPQSDPSAGYLTVSISNVKKEGETYVLHITVVSSAAQKFKINFTDPIITCQYTGSGNKINSGTEIKETESIVFKAKKQGGKVFEHWLVGQRKENGSENIAEDVYEFSYIVSKDDAKDGAIEVKIVFKEKMLALLMLKKNSIEAKKSTNDGSEEKLANGDKVAEGDYLSFELANDAETGKIVETWFINGKNISEFTEDAPTLADNRRSVSFSLTSTYIKNSADGKKLVEVDYNAREAKQIKIDFDSTKIECATIRDGNEVTVQSGEKVTEGENLTFRVKEGFYVADWKRNNVNIGGASVNSQEFSFIVFKNLATGSENDLAISISIEERQPADVIITFNAEKIECKKGSDVVSTDTKIKEGTVLTFMAKDKDLKADEKIRWNYGDGSSNAKAPNEPNMYKVRLIDAFEGKIEISWEKE